MLANRWNVTQQQWEVECVCDLLGWLCYMANNSDTVEQNKFVCISLNFLKELTHWLAERNGEVGYYSLGQFCVVCCELAKMVTSEGNHKSWMIKWKLKLLSMFSVAFQFNFLVNIVGPWWWNQLFCLFQSAKLLCENREIRLNRADWKRNNNLH